LITFVAPIGLMMAFPAKAFFGLLSGPLILVPFTFSAIMMILSLRLWRLALRQYSSASS
jgi:ABC-type uncharacterized transport system permease subunit